MRYTGIYIHIYVHLSFTVLRPLWELSARQKTTTIGQKAVRETDVSRQHGGSIDGPSKIPRTSSHYCMEGGPQPGTRHAKRVFRTADVFFFQSWLSSTYTIYQSRHCRNIAFPINGMCFQNCTRSGMCFRFQNCTQIWMCTWVSLHWTRLSDIPFNLVQYTFHFKTSDLKGQ